MYFNLRTLPRSKHDCCINVMKDIFPYFKRNGSVSGFDALLGSIITYVKNSRIPQNKIESELDYVVNALYTPFDSNETVIMFMDSKGKLIVVNNAFQKVYKYNKEQVLNNYVGKYTQTVWFKKLIDKPGNFEASKYFPGNHTNTIKRADKSSAVIIGNTWPLIDNDGKFYGAVSVHKKLSA